MAVARRGERGGAGPGPRQAGAQRVRPAHWQAPNAQCARSTACAALCVRVCVCLRARTGPSSGGPILGGPRVRPHRAVMPAALCRPSVAQSSEVSRGPGKLLGTRPTPIPAHLRSLPQTRHTSISPKSGPNSVNSDGIRSDFGNIWPTSSKYGSGPMFGQLRPKLAKIGPRSAEDGRARPTSGLSIGPRPSRPTSPSISSGRVRQELVDVGGGVFGPRPSKSFELGQSLANVGPNWQNCLPSTCWTTKFGSCCVGDGRDRGGVTFRGSW